MVKKNTDNHNSYDEALSISQYQSPLLVTAENIAKTVAQGLHGRKRIGIGENFWEYRHYYNGSDTSKIDWRKSATSNHIYIKENEWETSNTILLWVDNGKNMGYRSHLSDISKGEVAKIIAVATAMLMQKAGERTGILGAYIPPSSHGSIIQKICSHLEQDSINYSSINFNLIVKQQYLPARSYILLFSDFLSETKEITDIILQFANKGCKGHLIQILDPAELTIPYDGHVIFKDHISDANNIAIGNVAEIRENYIKLINNHNKELDKITKSIGWSKITHQTNTEPHQLLQNIYFALTKK